MPLMEGTSKSRGKWYADWGEDWRIIRHLE